jgi:hypothetical protein
MSASRKPFVSPMRVKNAQGLGHASGGDIWCQVKGGWWEKSMAEPDCRRARVEGWIAAGLDDRMR